MPGNLHRKAAGLLSDVTGRITRVAFALPGEEPDVVPPLADCMGSVLRALGRGTRALVLHHPEQQAAADALARAHTVESLRWTRPRTLRFQPGRMQFGDDGVLRLGPTPIGDYTPWIQDTCLVRRTPQGPGLLANPDVVRPAGGLDTDVPALLARHLGWPLEPLPVPVDAANVLVNQDHVVIGRDALTGRHPEARAVLDLLAPEGTRALLVPATGPQPVRHLDMVLAPAGRCGPDQRPTMVVASPALATQVTGAKADVPASRAEGLDRLADDLAAAGYDVVRVPGTRRRARPEWKPGWLSWTNVLVEHWQEDGVERRRVILPAYGTDGGPAAKDLDAAAAESWRGLGFAVDWAEGPFTWMATFDAGVRCLTKVLARGETERGR